MSTPLSLAGYAQARAVDPERWHRRRLLLAATAAVLLVVALAAYGWDYYRLPASERPFAELHRTLKPGGTMGIRLGMLGAGMFLVIFLYPIRKRIGWLARRGSSKHWLDFHVILGLTAPFIIALHSSFKFRGIAGIAFWIMVAVALSGIVGRYVYAQIPRSLSSAELSLKELKEERERLSQQLASQRVFSPAELAPLFALPSAEEIKRMPALAAVTTMFRLDLAREFHVLRLRAKAATLFRQASRRELEQVISAARQHATLAKRIAFLDRSHRVFHLWHVVHRPFSYSFATLALLHIGLVVLLGFF